MKNHIPCRTNKHGRKMKNFYFEWGQLGLLSTYIGDLFWKLIFDIKMWGIQRFLKNLTIGIPLVIEKPFRRDQNRDIWWRKRILASLHQKSQNFWLLVKQIKGKSQSSRDIETLWKCKATIFDPSSSQIVAKITRKWLKIKLKFKFWPIGGELTIWRKLKFALYKHKPQSI